MRQWQEYAGGPLADGAGSTVHSRIKEVPNRSAFIGERLFCFGIRDGQAKMRTRTRLKSLPSHVNVFRHFRRRIFILGIILKKNWILTNRYIATLLDTPGHKDFVGNMLRGIAQADVGVLVVPADSSFESTVAKGNVQLVLSVVNRWTFSHLGIRGSRKVL